MALSAVSYVVLGFSVCANPTCWRLSSGKTLFLLFATGQEEELSELGRGVMLYRRLGLEFEGGDLGEDGSMKCLRLVFRQVCNCHCFVYAFLAERKKRVASANRGRLRGISIVYISCRSRVVVGDREYTGCGARRFAYVRCNGSNRF